MQLFSPFSALLEHASRQPETEAIILEDLVIAYGEFVERVSAFARWLLHHGFVPGEVTGLCIRDEVDHLVCAMALLCLGTPQLSLASHENGTTKRSLARKVGVTQLVIQTPHDWMAGLRTIVVPIGDPNAVAAACGSNLSSLFIGRSLDSICLYQNTSGSTNIPKTFGLTLGRVLSLSERYRTILKSAERCTQGLSNSTPIVCIASALSLPAIVASFCARSIFEAWLLSARALRFRPYTWEHTSLRL